jgi:hypothetical protein
LVTHCLYLTALVIPTVAVVARAVADNTTSARLTSRSGHVNCRPRHPQRTLPHPTDQETRRGHRLQGSRGHDNPFNPGEGISGGRY